MYFDSHAHLDDERFQKDFEEILARMKHSGVTAMMNIGCDLPSSENSVRLAETYPWVWAAVGRQCLLRMIPLPSRARQGCLIF